MVYAMFGAAEIKRDRGTGEYMVDDWVTLLGGGCRERSIANFANDIRPAQTHLESLQKLNFFTRTRAVSV